MARTLDLDAVAGREHFDAHGRGRLASCVDAQHSSDGPGELAFSLHIFSVFLSLSISLLVLCVTTRARGGFVVRRRRRRVARTALSPLLPPHNKHTISSSALLAKDE